MVLYHILWTLVVSVVAPTLAFKRADHARSRLIPRLPSVGPKPGCLWIHAMSVGEVLSAIPLVRALAGRHPGRATVFTVTTKQGWIVAQRKLGREPDFLLRMPLDFWMAYRRLVTFVRPAVFLPVETDLWPGLIHHLGRNGIPTVVVNGRISPRTAARYKRFGALSRVLLKSPSLWLMQTHLDAERLVSAGAPETRVHVTGNIKFDHEWKPMDPRERRSLCSALGLKSNDTIWVAGSTHPGEDEEVLTAFQGVIKSFPRLRLVLAPRRVERAHVLCDMARARGLTAAVRSASERDKVRASVLVLDTLGELGRVYGLGSIAFVGGSLVPVGGHNLLEPASFGVPIVFGPHMHNFESMSEMLLEMEGCRRVEDAQGLEQAVGRFLADPEEAERAGRSALRFVEENKGALERVLACIAEKVHHGD